uniref:Uncharacterized protein n=1 Tax=Schlesneria paludicola TaxID=360056 RepID=A0A7C2NY92_9PLAN
MPRRLRLSILLAGLVLCSTWSTPATLAADAKPATAAEAAKVLDLGKFPLLAGAEEPRQRHVAGLSYAAKGDVKAAFEFQRKQFTDKKWQELPNGYVTDQFANGTFSKDGFKVSVSVMPGAMPGMVDVTMINHGNVDLDKLSTPDDAKPLFAGPVSKMLVTEAAPDKTAEAVRKLLLAQGWQPYGQAGDQYWFKQNSMKLSAHIASAPGQGGKTVIDLQSVLMSADLPAPPEADKLQYSDVPAQLSFDSAQPMEKVIAFYKSTLEKSGWKATTENPVKIGFRDIVIFRNPAKDLLELEMHTVDGNTRVLLKHQTAAEVAALDQRLDEEQKRKAAEKDQPSLKVAVTIPAGATGVEIAKQAIEFKLPSGKARAAVETLRKQFAKDGWKEDTPVVEDMAGSIGFKKGEATLSLTYVDPGFIPAEVSLSAIGIELERAAEKK